MSTPEPGQVVEVTIRGRVTRTACKGRAVLITRDDGQDQWIDLPDDLIQAVTWRPR